jgi:stromal membrane-associated protein
MSTRTARSSKQQNERHAAILRELLKQPSNRKCADCKRNDPRWASWNLGIFICIRCSGVHRSMGTHISKVKSVDLDTWTPDQIENMKKWGNYKANLYWEANMTERDKFQENNFERWIRSKYEFKRFVKSDELPDPDTLPNENGESGKVTTSSTKQSAKPLVSTEEVQGIFSTSGSSKKPSNNNNNNNNASSSNDIFLFQDFVAPPTSSSNNNQNNATTNVAAAAKVSNNSSQQNKNDFKNSILSLYNTSSSSSKPANTNNSFAQFGNATTMNPATGMPLAFQASPMQPQSSGGFGSPMKPQASNGFGSTMQPQSSNGFGSTMQPTMGFGNMMQPQSSGFGMQSSNGFGNSMNNSGFNNTMQPSKPAAPKHDPFDFISLSSLTNNATKTTNNPTTTTNNNNANDDFSDFQTASSGNSNWANF